jgi:FAD/FMN-containing dehydrogenase
LETELGLIHKESLMSLSASHPSVVSTQGRLDATIDGRVIVPGDADYDQARAVYGGFDGRPAAIVRPAHATDVSQAVSLARDQGLALAVRSGGHSLAGHSTIDGGVVLDLRDLRRLEIDAAQRTAWAQTGLTAGAYTTAVGAHGLATSFGDTASVGIGGLTLGGGIGYLVRKHGLTIDDLLAAELVTADGQLLRVDAETHPELFWAIRGGGGNFGVATRFRFRLHEVPSILGGMLLLPATPEVVAAVVAEAEAAPEELSVIANIMRAPPMPPVPEPAHGKLVVMAQVCWAGDLDAGERVMTRFRGLAPPILDLVQPMPYAGIYQLTDGRPEPDHEALRSRFLDAVDLPTAEAIVEHLQAATAPVAVAQLRVLGGAMARVPADATAFAHRRRRILAAVAAVWERPEETPVHQAWVDGLVAALAQGDPGAYVNFVGDEGQVRVREAYPGSTWERLVAVKRRYDPDNLFRRNQNIPPAPHAPGGRRSERD